MRGDNLCPIRRGHQHLRCPDDQKRGGMRIAAATAAPAPCGGKLMVVTRHSIGAPLYVMATVTKGGFTRSRRQIGSSQRGSRQCLTHGAS